MRRRTRIFDRSDVLGAGMREETATWDSRLSPSSGAERMSGLKKANASNRRTLRATLVDVSRTLLERTATALLRRISSRGPALAVMAVLLMPLFSSTALAQAEVPPTPYIRIRADHCAMDGSSCTNLGSSGHSITSAAPSAEYRAQWSGDRLAGKPALLFPRPAQFALSTT